MSSRSKRNSPPGRPTPPKANSLEELSPQEKGEYENSVRDEVSALLERRGCEMIARPVYTPSPAGGFVTQVVAEVKLKQQVVIKKES